MNDHIYRPKHVAYHTCSVCSKKYGSFYDTTPHRSLVVRNTASQADVPESNIESKTG
jgi:hypothetical protein